MNRLCLLILFLLGTPLAQARVFDFSRATVAPYIRGTGGTDAMGQDAFIHSSGQGSDIKSKSNYNYSGEVGFNWGIGEILSLRLGAELISSIPVSNAAGMNSTSGAQRFNVTSNITVFNPNATLEIIIKKLQSTRFYLMGGVGFATGNLTNSYKMTTTGTTELGVNDYDEKAVGSSTTYTAGLGLETLFTDNVTLSFDLGYRYLKIQNWTHTGAGKTIAQGTVAEGDKLLNTGGTTRRVDLGGPFVGMTLRFYIDFGGR